MAENSLFAVLMRSRWWISFAICAAVVLISLTILPKDISPFAALGAFPFFVVGCIAFYKQFNAPSPALLQQIQQVTAEQSWPDFSAQLQSAWQAEGYEVKRLTTPGADFLLSRNGQTTTVSARRWKAATHGMEPLRELQTAHVQQHTDQAVYAALQPLGENASIWASQHQILVLDGHAMATLIAKNRQKG